MKKITRRSFLTVCGAAAAAAALTLLTVSAGVLSGSRRARDTVESETFALTATSFMVARVLLKPFSFILLFLFNVLSIYFVLQ